MERKTPRKKIQIIGIILIIGQFLVLFDCPPQSSSTSTAAAACVNQATAYDADNGSEIRLAIGDILTLKLEAKLGTGASWKVVCNDPQILEQLGEPTQAPIKNEDLNHERRETGAAEYQVFKFKALARGVNLLELKYARWWSAEHKVEKVYHLTVYII